MRSAAPFPRAWSRRRLAALIALACMSPLSARPAAAQRLSLSAPPEMIDALAPALARFSEESSIKVDLLSANPRRSQANLAQIISGRLHAAMLLDEPVVRPLGPYKSQLIAYDAIALIANGLNPVSGLSKAQVAAMYGGASADWPGSNKPVVRLVRDADLPERKQFEQALGITRANDDGVHVVAGAMASILFVAVDPLAIGYVSAALAVQMAAEGARIKLLEVQGVSPSAANLSNGNYPMRRAVHLVTSRTASMEVLRLAEFLRGPQVREALRLAGYAPALP